MTGHAGSATRYNQGCRCDGCRAVHSARWRTYKANRTTTPAQSQRMPEPPAPKRRERVTAGVHRTETDTWPGRP